MYVKLLWLQNRTYNDKEWFQFKLDVNLPQNMELNLSKSVQKVDIK
jgi:hypothetical protein